MTNSNTEVALNARLYRCSETTLTCSGNYRNGSLRVVKTTDEDGNVSYEFKDKVERLILSRQMNGAEWLDTYYVYDNAGNLRFVLPPLAADVLTGSSGSWNEDNVALKKYAYIYKYDSKNRCIYKKLPGCGPVYTVYDAADRAIFTQDDMQRDKGEWLFSIPDAFGRIVLTGTCKNVLNYSMTPLGSTIIVKATLDKTTNATKGYVVSGITLNTPVILTARYFDSYDFIGQNDFPSGTATAYESADPYGKRYDGGCRGQQTGSLTARLSKTGSVTGYLYSVMYYDDRYRMIQQKGNNELNGTKQTYIAYSFTGQPTEVKQVYAIPGEETITEIRKHTYDHADRLLRTTYQLNNDPLITLVDNVYDEVGRLKSERRNGNPKLKTDYGYNIRSWTRSISGSLFNQTLYYQDQLEGNTPCYNGNISSVLWKAGPSNNESGYRFTYDGLNRMKNAIYGETNSLSVNPNRFNEQITAYDKKGNILGLLRYGQTSSSEYGLIDNLNLTYDGNQLQAVKDNATHSVFGNGMEFKDGANQTIEYAYDKNGNLTKDLNKKIAVIQYNLLNLPSQVIFVDGNVIEYEYGSDGRKLRTAHVINGVTSITDYCGNAIYENGSLKMLLNEAGYISFPDKKFHFYLKDHQGNIRVVADKDGYVEETNDYYPFGGLFTASRGVQPYKYNGKELDRKNGIDWYDYGARHYDPAIGRWHVVDPMSKKYYSWSPYTYCKNNPVLRIDLDGKDDYIVSETGRLTRLNVPTETDILYTYSGDSKNPKGGNKIEMTEKGLLEEMVKVQQSHNGYKSFGASTNIADASNLFQFVAENTKVEWSLSVFESGGVHTAIIATDQQPNTVQNGISAKNNLGVVGESKVQIHSHPDSGGTKGGYGNDLRNANPKSKNLVYFQANRILYEYNNTKSNIKETPVVEKNRYI